MTQSHDDYAEQLSAFMDGELPDAEARFLLRRLEHDAELRAAWMRMQLASACLRGQAWQPMPAELAERVAVAIAAPARSGLRRPLLGWAAAASIAAVALVFAPRLLQPQQAAPARAVAELPAGAADHMVASPASADLVALRQASPAAAPEPQPATASPVANASREQALVATVERSDRASPVPLSTQAGESPSDFPLVDTGEERRWPRSEVVAGASSDPSIEAYLVRHNQMLANDGLGGFVPYVDVVANRQSTAPEGAAAADPEQ